MDQGERLRHVKSVLEGSLWVLPTVAVAVALLLGVLLGHVEAEPDVWGPLVFDGGASAARSLLEAMVTALITVTSLTFSLMVLVLQNAASEYSPRLLRKFLRDLKNQTVLAVFLSAFAFCVVVLPTIQDADGSGDADDGFVPRLAVSVALLLAVASIGALVLLIYNITQSIRVDAIMSGVERDTAGAIDRNDEHLDAARTPDEAPDPPPESAVPLRARSSGYMQAVQDEHLVGRVAGLGVVVHYRRTVGEQVVRGAPLAVAWRPDGQPVDDVEALEGALEAHTQIGYERTLQEDIAFGLRQLTDIAVKALSPGVNDPSTAVDALGRLASLLRELADRRLGGERVDDADGQARLIIPRPTFRDYLGLVVEPISRSGAGDLTVVTQLLRVLEDLGTVVRTAERREAVLRAVDLVALRANSAMELQRSRERVDHRVRSARAAVDGDVPVDGVFVL